MNRLLPVSALVIVSLLFAVGCGDTDMGDTADTSNPSDTDTDTTDTDTDTDDSEDTTAPTALSSQPMDGALGVAINSRIRVIFSEPLDPTSVNDTTFTVMADGNPVEGLVTFAGTAAIFTPTGDFAVSTVFDAEVTTGVTDVAGNPLGSAYAWSFTTGETADDTAPTVLSTTPSDFATDVAVTRTIRATFSELLDPSTINLETFLVMAGTDAVEGRVTLVGITATFTPTTELASETSYEATLSDGIQDLAGRPMADGYTWRFTTADSEPVPGSVDLQSAADYAVLAGSTVVSTGLTEIFGNLGVSPGTAVDGFPPGIVEGTTHAGNSAAALAALDLTTAYNDAAGRSTAPVSVSGNLGGQTLAPGLYTSGSSLEISSGDLTLDAAGDSNAVWIFQMPSTLTTTSGRQVILSGGAQAANVYWQVGSSCTLGSTSVMHGNILADQSITLETGATLNGRALTRIGAVSLDSNVITLP